MKRLMIRIASMLAISLVFLGMTVPLTAFADDAMPITIATMGENEHTVAVEVLGGRLAKNRTTTTISVNGTPQEGLSVPASQGDTVSVSVAPKEPNYFNYTATSFDAVDSNGATIECQVEEPLQENDGYVYLSHVYTFTMPDSDVTASCALGNANQFTAYCVSGWDDYGFVLTNASGDTMTPLKEGEAQGIPYKVYYVLTGEYNYELNENTAGATLDAGSITLNSGNSNINWNKLTVTVNPAEVEGLGSFGTESCVCTRADGEVKLPITSSEDDSGLYSATFLLKGGDPSSGSTDYTVSAAPKDERCSIAWVSGDWVDGVQLTGENINVTSITTQRCIAKANLKASEIMETQGSAITELNGYDPENYLDAQKAEVVRIASEAVEAIKAADSEEAIAELLANAKQALDAIETAGQVEENAAPVVNAIIGLKPADGLTIDDKEAVENARAAYDLLTDAEKAYVGEANLLKLELAEAVIEKLTLAEQVSALEGEKKNLEDQVTALNGDKEALENQITTLDGEKQDLDKKLSEAEGKAKEAESALAEAEGKLKAAEENLAKAEERAKKAEDKLAKAAAAKKANTMKVSAKAKTLKAAKLAKKAQSFKAITVKNAKGKVSYAKVKVDKKKFAKKFSVNKKTGKITVKKGVKKGTYKLTVKVTAAGNKAYKAKTVKKVVKITVA